MLLTHKNTDDYIYAYFEFDIVDINGIQKDNELFMYVRDLWVHKKYNGEVEIAKFIIEANAHPQCNNLRFIHWMREKNGIKRISKSFSRATCVRLAKRILNRKEGEEECGFYYP